MKLHTVIWGAIAFVISMVFGFGWWQSYRSADGMAYGKNGRGVGASSYDGTLIFWFNFEFHEASDDDGFTTFHDTPPPNPSPFGRFILANESGSFQTDLVIGIPYPLVIFLTLVITYFAQRRNISSS